jgi:hypothetical protein
MGMKRRRERCSYDDQYFLNVWDDSKTEEGETDLDAENETEEKWYKVTVSILTRFALARLLWLLKEGRLY